MDVVAVELDDQRAVGPCAVDFIALDEGVGLGCWETAVIEEGEEAGLELASCVGAGAWRWARPFLVE